MTTDTLAADIARIAALRGRTAEDYVDAETGNYRPHLRQDFIGTQLLANIFMPHPNARADLDAYDRMPSASRRFVRDSPLQLNATCYAAALDHVSAEGLEILVTTHMPAQIATWVRRHYGSSHPSLRRLP